MRSSPDGRLQVLARNHAHRPERPSVVPRLGPVDLDDLSGAQCPGARGAVLDHPRVRPAVTGELRALHDGTVPVLVPADDRAEGGAAARHVARLRPRRRRSKSRAGQYASVVTRLPPALFERYMAASARCIRSSTSSPGWTSATPTLAVTPEAAPTTATACRSRSASISPEKATETSARTANSSPPRRATVSVSRTAPPRAVATDLSM